MLPMSRDFQWSTAFHWGPPAVAGVPQIPFTMTRNSTVPGRTWSINGYETKFILQSFPSLFTHKMSTIFKHRTSKHLVQKTTTRLFKEWVSMQSRTRLQRRHFACGLPTLYVFAYHRMSTSVDPTDAFSSIGASVSIASSKTLAFRSFSPCL